MASYSPPPAHPLETTGTVAPRSVAAVHAAGHGPTTIIVGTSDTLEILAHRYNVSAAAIMQANGYKGPRVLSPGQQLIIPRQTAAITAPVPAAPASQSVAAAAPAVHVVSPGDTLIGIAHRNHIPVTELAKANATLQHNQAVDSPSRAGWIALRQRAARSSRCCPPTMPPGISPRSFSASR